MGNPKVSVIMGIYNVESTLKESLDSIYNQTFKNFEVIVCDDGSSDKTEEIARLYCEEHKDNFVLLKNDKNMGLNFTLNKCLAAAKGVYIARQDGDDISLPERFSKEVEFLDNNPEYALVSTPMIYFNENGEFARGRSIEAPTVEDVARHNPVFCHAPCIIRKDAFIEVGGYTEDKRLLRVEDCHLWYKLYSFGYKGYNLSEPLYMMRDDSQAYKRRNFKNRMNTVYCDYVGYKMLKMPWYRYIHVVKTFVRGVILTLIPGKLYTKLHKRKINK